MYFPAVALDGGEYFMSSPRKILAKILVIPSQLKVN